MEKLLAWLNKEKQYDITIVYFDLNHFKQLNDTYGHDTGDNILCIFSTLLTSIFGESGYVGRIGGDEFIVVLRNTSEEETLRLCNQVTIQLKEQSNALQLKHNLSTSYGYAIRKRGSTESLDNIITKADEAMYTYKRMYNNQEHAH